jgi:hypothetical protein
MVRSLLSLPLLISAVVAELQSLAMRVRAENMVASKEITRRDINRQYLIADLARLRKS